MNCRGYDKTVFFCDALNVLYFLGLSPDLQSMEQIRRIMRPTDVPDTGIEKQEHFIYLNKFIDIYF